MDTIVSTAQPIAYSDSDKQAHVKQWQSSGQSKQNYAQQQGIKYGTFKNWVEKYHGKSPRIIKTGVSNFVSLDVKQSPSVGSCYAEIHYPNGSRLVIHKPMPIEELRRLLP